MPASSASASTNGLNAEPGWRWPWVARLNGCAGVVVAADHRAHLAGLVVDRDERGARAASGSASQCVTALLGGLLELEVERRAHLSPPSKARRAPLAAAELVDDLLAYPGREVRVRACPRAGGWMSARVGSASATRVVVLAARDVALLEHPLRARGRGACLAAAGARPGRSALGDATMPASSAASCGLEHAARSGWPRARRSRGALLPKYVRAADSMP